MPIEPLDLSEARAAIGPRREAEKRELSLVKREERLAQRNWNAAQVGRTTLDWGISILSRDQKIWTDLRKLRSRSRELADNESTMSTFLNLCVANVSGEHGIQMRPKVKKLRGDTLADTLNQQIKDEWKEWCQRGNCTMDGLMSFDELERLLVRTAALDGEFIVILKAADNPWGFALQFVDTDQLDPTFFDEQRGGQTFIRMGVEIDKFRKPVAYWLFTKHPNEYTTSPNNRVRVLAENCVHAYLPDSALQTRGVPWAAPAMYKMNMLRGYMEAELVAARVGACQMGVVINKGGTDFEGEGVNEDGTVKMEAEPGGFMQFTGDYDFKQFDPKHPGVAFAPFVNAAKRDVAATLGVAYTSLTSDYSQVNFSSARAELMAERQMWRVRQKWMIEAFHKRVFRAWLAMSVLRGRINLSVRDEDDVASQIQWHPRGWDWVDPLKDIQASAESVQNGFSTRTRILAKQGLDFEDVVQELADEIKLIKSLGLYLGTDAKGDATAPEDLEEGAVAGQAAGQEAPPDAAAKPAAKPAAKKTGAK